MRASDDRRPAAGSTAEAAAAGDGASAFQWGEQRLAIGRSAFVRLHGLELWVRRAAAEWRLAWRTASEREGRPAIAEITSNAGSPPQAGVEADRFVFREAPERLTFVPRVADRPVVVSPRVAVSVLPGEEVTLFVSSPVWLEVAVGEPASVLCEIPVTRPSDTWFGTNFDGELCYHLLTHARLSLDEMVRLPYRAVTPLAIHNRSDEALRIDRVKLPVPNLSLFLDAKGLLWTESVNLSRDQPGELASLDVEPGAPVVAGGAGMVSPPRLTVEKNHLIRAFGSLFG